MRVSSTARSNFSGVAAEPRRQPEHQERHGDFGNRGQQQKDEHEAGQSFFRKLACGLAALAFQAPGEQRHEGRVESALAEQAAEKIGKSKRHEEGVGHRA